MGHWITVGDDDQHVYVTDSGKIAATRSAISRAGGAKERGKALAARSKAAIGKALAGKGKPSLKEQAAAHRAKQRGGLTKTHVEMTASVLRQQHALKTGNDEQFMKLRGRWNELDEQTKEYRSVGRGNAQRTNSSALIAHEVAGSVEDRVKGRVAARTQRAIEHAKAAGPSLREQADKARAAKGTPEQRKAALLARAKGALSKHTEKSPDQDLADRLKATGTKKGIAEAKKIESRWPQHLKESDVLRGRLKPLGHKTLAEQAKAEATTRAIEHAKAAGPGQANPHLNAAHDVALKLSSGKLNLENEQALMKHFKADSLSGLYSKLKGYQTDPEKAKALATIGNRKIRTRK